LAAYNDVTFPQAADVYLSGFDKTLQVSVNSAVNSIIVDTTAITVVLEKDGSGSSSITFTSTDRMTLNNNGGFTPTCDAGSSTLTLTTPTSVGTLTVLVSPSQNVCSSSGGSSGTGGTGTTTVSTPSPSPSATPSPSPSPSATPSPSPSVTPSPSPAPTALVPIPTVPANPTPTQIQAAITAIINNIAYLQAELLKLQQPTTTQAFTQDLFYGLWNNAEVKRLQEFLISKGYLASGLNTGNYFTKTVEAVKAYQTAKGITPVSGYFGPKTRTAVNSDLGL
jgi:hypothetical protein